MGTENFMSALGGMDKSKLAMFGLQLMNQGQGQSEQNNNDLGSLLLEMSLKGMFKNQNAGNAGQTPLTLGGIGQGLALKSDTPPPPMQEPTTTPTGLNPDGILTQLKQAAIQAYPDNPKMQQVALSQAILESGLQNGKMSGLAQQNNFFGIKAPGTAGTVNMPTNEFMNGQNQRVNAGFGANQTPGDSFNQYKTLMNKPRYAGVLAADTPEQAFAALQQSGYATDPNYGRKLKNVFNNYIMPMYA